MMLLDKLLTNLPVWEMGCNMDPQAAQELLVLLGEDDGEVGLAAPEVLELLLGLLDDVEILEGEGLKEFLRKRMQLASF